MNSLILEIANKLKHTVSSQNFLKGEVDTRINKLKSLSLINLFHKLSEIVDVNV